MKEVHVDKKEVCLPIFSRIMNVLDHQFQDLTFRMQTTGVTMDTTAYSSE